MSAEVNVSVSFKDDFEGILTSTNGSSINISMEQIRPYDMLLGALISCYHHTFLEIVGKKRQTVANVNYHIYGRKRDTVPTMLEYVRINVIVENASDRTQINKSLELAKKYCSVYQTISHVAEIEVMIEHQNS